MSQEFPVISSVHGQDPSEPAPPVRVVIEINTWERGDAVARFLEAHGIASSVVRRGISFLSGAWVYACVPVPMLVLLSEQLGVLKIEKEIPPVLYDPAVIEEESWGAIKNRFK